MTRVTAARPLGLRVLVVEDDADERDAAVAVIESVGCVADVAFDGGAAVSRTLALQPDVIVMDLDLPIIDGWRAIRQIRQMTSECPPVIVVVTGRGDERSRSRALEAGCDELLLKPCDLRAVLRRYAVRSNHRDKLTHTDKPVQLGLTCDHSQPPAPGGDVLPRRRSD